MEKEVIELLDNLSKRITEMEERIDGLGKDVKEVTGRVNELDLKSKWKDK